MNVKERIFEVILEARDGEVLLEDVLSTSCAYRHYLRASGATANPARDLTGPEMLLREVSRAQVDMVRRYLKGCYKDRFSETRSQSIGLVTFDTVGLLDDVLVDVAILSTTRFNRMKPPRSAVLAAAAKAAHVQLEKALLITMDRNTQEWAFFGLEGDLQSATKLVLDDVHFIGHRARENPVGTASEKTCKACPFEAACEANRTGDDPPFLTIDGILVKPAPHRMAEVDGHLWALNRKPNNRKKGVIHPSEFSTSPCDRKIAYGILALDELESINPKLRRIFDTGHCFHNIIQAALDWAFPGFRDEVRVEHEGTKIVGHCDGVFPSPDEEYGAEIKSINLNGFSRLKKAKSDHEKQATLYGAILELLGIKYIYACKETGELAVYSVPVDRTLWHRQATRATNIVRTVEEGELPPRVDKEYLCKGCKYAWKCMPKLAQTAANSPKKRAFRR